MIGDTGALPMRAFYIERRGASHALIAMWPKGAELPPGAVEALMLREFGQAGPPDERILAFESMAVQPDGTLTMVLPE